jgi:hypothetical protein
MKDKKPNTLLLITSYGEVPLLINTLSDLENDNTNAMIVIFENEDLKKFFEILKKSKFKSISKIHLVRRYPRKKYIKNYFAERRYYKHCLNKLNNLQSIKLVYCFSIYQNGFCCLTVNKFLNQAENIFIYEPVAFAVQKRYGHSITNLLRKILNLYIYDGCVSSKGLGHKNIDIMSRKILSNSKVSFFNSQKTLMKKSKIDVSKFFKYNHSYTAIFFEQPLVNYGRVSDRSYLDFINKLKEVFKKEVGQKKFAVKLHPGNHSNRKFYDGLQIIDGYIPSECIDQNSKFWLSISSLSISHTTKKIKKISLINIIEFKNKDTANVIKGNLQKNSFTEIEFPKSFDDLSKIREEILV